MSFLCTNVYVIAIIVSGQVFTGSATAPLPLLSHHKGMVPPKRMVDVCVFLGTFRYVWVYFCFYGVVLNVDGT